MAFHVSCCTHWAFLGYSWGISGILDGIIPGHSWGIYGIPIDPGANLTVILNCVSRLGFIAQHASYFPQLMGKVGVITALEGSSNV